MRRLLGTVMVCPITMFSATMFSFAMFSVTMFSIAMLLIKRLYNRSGQFNDIAAEELMHTAEVANMKGSPALNLDDRTLYGIESRIIRSGTTTLSARLTQAKVEYIEGIIASSTPASVDLVPLQFRVFSQGGLKAGTWPTSESFVLHNYSTASTPADRGVSMLRPRCPR